MQQPTASIITLGCRLNQADSALLAERLKNQGFLLINSKEPADLILINSCTVTGVAAQKTHRALHAARRRSPHAFIVVAGCDPEVNRQTWESEPDADLILGNQEKHRLIEFLTAFSSEQSLSVTLKSAWRGNLIRPEQTANRHHGRQAQTVFSHRQSPGNNNGGNENLRSTWPENGIGYYPHKTRANLKIQDGCDFFCSYCIVPYARGAPRSRPPELVLEEARQLLARNHRELVLTGVNLARYQYNKTDLTDLTRQIAALPGDFRLRLSSIEPTPIVKPLLEVIKNSKKICRFLHLPLQYGEDRILQKMNRNYTVKDYASLADLAVQSIPGLCLGTDVMVGFPGETDSIFNQCMDTVEALPFANIHVFRYSPRPGTAAAALENSTPPQIIEHRHRQIRRLSIRKAHDFAASQYLKKLHVLVEKEDGGGGGGWSDNYLRVHMENLPRNTIGSFVETRIEKIVNGLQVTGKVQHIKQGTY